MTEVSAPQGQLPFDAFYVANYRGVVGLAYALSGSSGAAEDLAQEAFTVAYRRWPEVSEFDDPGVWVRRVVANRSVSAVRRRITEARTVYRLGRQRPPLAELSGESTDVWRAVRRLPRRQAQAVALYYLEDRGLDDVAAVLGCSVETVRTHLRRARKALAGRLRLDDGDNDGR